MRKIPRLFLPALLMLSTVLAGCSHSAKTSIIAPCVPDASLMAREQGPKPLPKGGMSEKNAVRYWGRDRHEFRQTAQRKNDLVKFVQGECR